MEGFVGVVVMERFFEKVLFNRELWELIELEFIICDLECDVVV